jgi:hypothetical protein
MKFREKRQKRQKFQRVKLHRSATAIDQFHPLLQNVQDNRRFSFIAVESKSGVTTSDYLFACSFTIFGGIVQINPKRVGNLTYLKLADFTEAISREPEGSQRPWVVQIGQATKTLMPDSLIVDGGRAKSILQEWIKIRRRFLRVIAPTDEPSP